MRELAIKSLTKNLKDNIVGTPAKARIFNFDSGRRDLNCLNHKLDEFGSQDATWIRVYTVEGTYYDYVTSSLWYAAGEKDLLLLCAEDTQFIDHQYIANEIRKLNEEGSLEKSITNNDLLEKYLKGKTVELKAVTKELRKLYSASSQASTSRLNLEHTFNYGKLELEKKYLLHILIKQVIRENKSKILELF